MFLARLLSPVITDLEINNSTFESEDDRGVAYGLRRNLTPHLLHLTVSTSAFTGAGARGFVQALSAAEKISRIKLLNNEFSEPACFNTLFKAMAQLHYLEELWIDENCCSLTYCHTERQLLHNANKKDLEHFETMLKELSLLLDEKQHLRVTIKVNTLFGNVLDSIDNFLNKLPEWKKYCITLVFKEPNSANKTAPHPFVAQRMSNTFQCS